MRRHLLRLISLILAVFCGGTPHLLAEDAPPFIRAQGDQLFEGDQVFRFVSFNIPNLHLIEDAYDFARPAPWRWPDDYEIRDALESIRQLGGRVARTYVISVKRDDSNMGVHHHVSGPNQFNETAFIALDRVLATAREKQVRVIIPLVDNWHWWGGIKEYAAFRGKPKEAFWTDPQIRDDFKATIKHLLTRTNTINGLVYAEDPTILGWETGNELSSPPEWTADIARYIKSLDPHHLVIDGNSLNGPEAWSLADANIDVVTSHHYPNDQTRMRDAIRVACDGAAGRKPHFVGEFGFVPIEEVASILETVTASRSSGALLWSLRFHRREGGFYWHSEGAGDSYKAYHWPGFPSGEAYDEIDLFKLVRRTAHAISGAPLGTLPAPLAPQLLPTDSPFALSWQGATGANAYTVQRAPTADGPWQVIATDVSDAAIPYRPLFTDPDPPLGQPLYYRVIATNTTGASPPSNVIGPLTTAAVTMVDEFLTQAPRHPRLVSRSEQGGVRWRTAQARFAQEDLHRVSGEDGAHLTYAFDSPMSEVRLYAFANGQASGDVQLSVSVDGDRFVRIPLSQIRASLGATDYGQRERIQMQANLPADTRFLRLTFLGGSDRDDGPRLELSRLELDGNGP